MSTTWVTFGIGNDVYGVQVEFVREMVTLMPTRTVPYQAPDQLGVAILRKEVVPIMDLRKVFGIPGEQATTRLSTT
ncbi:MAG: chemotaxis protein CheW [bacterium]|nr:chemotaxis protein CheW [bacterium]